MKTRIITRVILRLINSETYTIYDLMNIIGLQREQMYNILRTVGLNQGETKTNLRIFNKDDLTLIIEYLIEYEKDLIKNNKVVKMRINSRKRNLKYYQDILALLYGDISVEYINSLPEFVPYEIIMSQKERIQKIQTIDVFLKTKDDSDDSNNN